MTSEHGAALIDVIAASALTLIMGAIAVPVIGGTLETFASSSNDVTQILQNSAVPVALL